MEEGCLKWFLEHLKVWLLESWSGSTGPITARSCTARYWLKIATLTTCSLPERSTPGRSNIYDVARGTDLHHSSDVCIIIPYHLHLNYVRERLSVINGCHRNKLSWYPVSSNVTHYQCFLETKRCQFSCLLLTFKPHALSRFSRNLLPAWKRCWIGVPEDVIRNCVVTEPKIVDFGSHFLKLPYLQM